MDSDIQIFVPKQEKHTQSQSQSQENQFTGLYNHGNTCYLNSLLQTLYMTPQFRASLIKWRYSPLNNPSKPDCIPYQLKKLFCRLQLRLHQIEETYSLTKSFQWNHNELLEQNDIQELLHVLLDAINEKFIYDIFQGILLSSIKCSECSSISSHQETFINLSLPIKLPSKHICNTLQESFKQMFTIEKLEKENMYYCDKCNKKVNADKYYEMNVLPEVLICALNRFEYDCKFECKKKVNNCVEFPMEFNVKEYIEYGGEDFKYELYAIIVHGGSARGGHYYAVIKCGDKWFKFDDSYVYEVELKEMESLLFGNEKTDTSAYMLLYRKSGNVVINENSEIDKDVMEDIEQEEEMLRKQKEEEKERMSYVNLSTFYNGQYSTIKIKKSETVQDFKLKIYELYKLSININDCRIRVFNSKNNKLLDILDNEYLTLEEVNANINKVYNLETKPPNGTFTAFNPNTIIIKTVIWNDSYTKVKDIEPNVKQIEIDKTLSYNNCILYLQNELHIQNDVPMLIMKKHDYGVNNFSFIPFEKNSEHFLEENVKLYIEPSCDNVNNSKFKSLFENEIAYVKIVFNSPLDPSKYKRITVKNYSFSNSIEINPKKTITELKQRLSEVVNIPVDEFIMKKNSHNGVEIKKYNDTIDKYTSKSLTLYLQLGKPIKPTDLKIHLQHYQYDNTVFALYPYKINDLGEHVIDKTWTVLQLLEHIEKKGIIHKDNENMKLYLRKENNFKPGSFYKENDVICKTDIKENQILILQYIEQKNVFSFVKKDDNENTLVQFGIRIWNHNTWKMSDIYEVIVSKNVSVETFITEYVNSIFELNDIKVNYQHLVGTKVYNKEMHFYMDDIDKMEFFPFVEFYSSLIENYPFMLNCNSCLLLLKDLSQEYREPSIQEQEYFYKKANISQKHTSSPKTQIPKKIHKPIKQEKYKEKAMVITVKQKECETNELIHT